MAVLLFEVGCMDVQSKAAALDKPREDGVVHGETFAALLRPLDWLLTSGGDARLRIDPKTRLNGYGCRPYPRPEAFTFASSTATSISERAYVRAEGARQALSSNPLQGVDEAFDARLEAMRCELKRHLNVERDAEVVFSPSGTDSQLHALFLARAMLGPRLVSVVVAGDETGSSTVFAAAGRHFSDYTAQGKPVEKGHALAGMGDCGPCISIPLRDAGGRLRSRTDVDGATIAAVAEAVAGGQKVLLHVMDRSKHGSRAPTQDCVREIVTRWPQSVMVVVDACQMRLGRARIDDYLRRGWMILLTGSKFFTGAPFSGALLVPASLSAQFAAIEAVPPGLTDYTNSSDWPMRWPAIRSCLSRRANLGQWLRWESALEEIRDYFAVPVAFRRAALESFAESVSARIANSASFELLAGSSGDPSDVIDDDEMAVRTIFPFLVRHHGRLLTPERCAQIYRALNRDMSSLLPAGASAQERMLARQLCHIGQPVALRDGKGGQTASLRISAGARIVSESWSGDAGTARGNLRAEIGQVETILKKIELLLKYFDALPV